MPLVDRIIGLIVGAIVEWLAGLWVGLSGNIAAGILGAVIAGWLLPHLEILIVGGVTTIINAVIGAVLLLLIIGPSKQANIGPRVKALDRGFGQCRLP